MQRDYDYEERRRRPQPKNDPRERYGNEEDPYSREYRRAYSERDLPQRLHDDRPYDRPGYEPEAGRPGGRENVDLDQGRNRNQSPRSNQGRYEDRWQGAPGGDPYGYDWEQPARRGGSTGQGQHFEGGNEGWQGGYYGQGQRFQGNPFDVDRQFRESGRRQHDNQPYQQQVYGQQNRRGSGQSGRSQGSGYGSSPYAEGDVGSWYGGDTGMGDYGASEPGVQSGGPYRSMHSGDRSEQSRRQTSGPFTGRGPRGYRRSDARIQEDVCEMLTRHGEIDASSMEVEVQHGTVFLRGMADSGHIRRLTEELVEGIHGVNDVQNELRVNQRTGYSNTGQTQTGSQSSHGGVAPQGNVPAYGVGVAETSGVSTRSGPGEPGVSAGAGRSQHGNPWQVRETMDVIGSDGKTVGTVKEVRGTDFLLDRPMERDLYVPFSAIQTVDGERVMLSCRSPEVDHQNWPSSSLTSTSEPPPAR
ncbi:MAG: BON domain-containing protein [Chloroflexota bacterium]